MAAALSVHARIQTVWTVVLCSLLVLLLRFFYLQVLNFDLYQRQSQRNIERTETLWAPRGRIYTRDGVLLAQTEEAVDLVYKGGPVLAWEKIGYIVGVPKMPVLPVGASEIRVAQNIPKERVSGLEEWVATQPSLELRRRTQRVYPQGLLAGHVLGYTAEANLEEVQRKTHSLGESVGRNGIEASMDALLRGHNGRQKVTVDAAGRTVSETLIDPGTPGQDIYLTLDSHLQKVAEQALREARVDINAQRRRHGLPQVDVPSGAIVALDPRNGEVLALASSPPINPNWFSLTPRPKELVSALTGKNGALINRAVTAFTPGSVFKPTSTFAFLEQWGNRTFTCVPSIAFGGRLWRNWAKDTMGPLDASGAIAQSCNTWYFQAALSTSPNAYSQAIALQAHRLGFGQVTGLPIHEDPGLVPDRSLWKTRGWNWYPGTALNIAIGQGALLVTPVQLASALSTFVNKGNKRTPILIRTKGSAQPSQQLGGSDVHWQRVLDGMRGTVVYGTASHILGPRHFPISTGGKTGTAQAPLSGYGMQAGTEHAWYEGYGPVENPDLVVVAFFENAGEGSAVALPAVRKIMADHWEK